MKVKNIKTGKVFFCEVESAEEAVIVAYEQNDKNNYGLTRYPGYSRYIGLKKEKEFVRCGDWIADRVVNKWNKNICQGCRVKIEHGPCRGFTGKVIRCCDSRTPYVEGIGYVMADCMYVVK